MKRLGTRAGIYALSIFIILSMQFLLVHSMPGDPLIHILGEENFARLVKDPEALKQTREQFGLNDSLLKNYLNFWKQVVKGDWGFSLSFGQPVFKVIKKRLPQTLYLVIPAFILSIIFSAIAGTWGGYRNGTKKEKFLTALFLGLYALPGFCLAMVLVAILSGTTGHICRGGIDFGGLNSFSEKLCYFLKQAALPVGVITLGATGAKYLVMKNTVIRIMNRNYILTAASKGLSDWRIMALHVFPNSLPQLINMAALNAGFLVSGSLLVEIIFSWQGMGVLMQQAALSRDYPLLMACFGTLSVCVILANFLADFFSAISDPRIGDGKSAP